MIVVATVHKVHWWPPVLVQEDSSPWDSLGQAPIRTGDQPERGESLLSPSSPPLPLLSCFSTFCAVHKPFLFLSSQFIDLCILLGCDYCDSVKGGSCVCMLIMWCSFYMLEHGYSRVCRSWAGKGHQSDPTIQNYRRDHETQFKGEAYVLC